MRLVVVARREAGNRFNKDGVEPLSNVHFREW